MNNAKKTWSQPSVSAVDVKMTMDYTYNKSGTGHDSIQPANPLQSTIMGSGSDVTMHFSGYTTSVTVSGGN